jgi:hypothetical protein
LDAADWVEAVSRAKVVEVMPDAHLERHRGNDRRTYYLVRQARQHMYLGQGSTPGQAWKDAWQVILPKIRTALALPKKNDP